MCLFKQAPDPLVSLSMMSYMILHMRLVTPRCRFSALGIGNNGTTVRHGA